MKINSSISLGGIYNKTGASVSTGALGAAAYVSKDRFSRIQDTITISHEGSRQNHVAGMARKIAGEIAAQDSPERIEELRKAVSAGTYKVSASEVAKSMLYALAE